MATPITTPFGVGTRPTKIFAPSTPVQSTVLMPGASRKAPVTVHQQQHRGGTPVGLVIGGILGAIVVIAAVGAGIHYATRKTLYYKKA